MTVEDERDLRGNDFVYDSVHDGQGTINGEAAGEGTRINTNGAQTIIKRYRHLTSNDIHYKLRNDLIDHLWCKKGNEIE